jgi:hypothetical protein
MSNGRCKVHGVKSTGPRTPEGLERIRRANWRHGYYSREGGTVAAAGGNTCAPRAVRLHVKAPAVPRPDTDRTGPFISLASMPTAKSLPRADGSGL